MDGFATLIGYRETQDDIGQWLPTEPIYTDIPVSVESVTRAEFFEAGRNGLNPSLVFSTALINYDGQKEIEYNGTRYGIYRTYYNSNEDEIELYAEQKGGVYEG